MAQTSKQTVDVRLASVESRLANNEAELARTRGDLAIVLTELRARGLVHLPTPEKKSAIRLSPEARQTRRENLAAHARQFSKGRTKGGKTRPSTRGSKGDR